MNDFVKFAIMGVIALALLFGHPYCYKRYVNPDYVFKADRPKFECKPIILNNKKVWQVTDRATGIVYIINLKK